MIKKLLALFIFLMSFNAVFAREVIQSDYNKTGKFHIYKINTKENGYKIRPYVVSKGLKSTSDIFKENSFALVVNGGFFDPKSAQAVSYVTIDKKTVNTPFENLQMIENLAKEGRLENVLNRTELRVLEHDLTGKLKFDINYHFAPVEKDYKIKHALGGGPMIHPDLDLEKEGFVKYDSTGLPISQSASVLKRRARTILALKDDYLYIIIFTNFAPATIGEAGHMLQKYKFDKVMALDGGASTSINYKDVEIFSSAGKQRELKSFLIVDN